MVACIECSIRQERRSEKIVNLRASVKLTAALEQCVATGGKGIVPDDP